MGFHKFWPSWQCVFNDISSYYSWGMDCNYVQILRLFWVVYSFSLFHSCYSHLLIFHSELDCRYHARSIRIHWKRDENDAFILSWRIHLNREIGWIARTSHIVYSRKWHCFQREETSFRLYKDKAQALVQI